VRRHLQAVGPGAGFYTWLRTALADYARDILAKDRLRSTGLFDRDYVTARLEEHLTGYRRNNKLLFSLIMFQEWYERHFA
jgi:asparagine synthase (glutamine-hydrolysing)